jgi:hypothetical protein
VDEVTKKIDAQVNKMMGQDEFRVADVGANGGASGGIRLPPGMKGKGNL